MDNERTGPALGRVNGDLVTAEAEDMQNQEQAEEAREVAIDLDLNEDVLEERSSEDIVKENLKEARAQRQLERNEINRGVKGAEGSQAHAADMAKVRQPDPSFLPEGRDPIVGDHADAQNQSSAKGHNHSLAV